MDKVQIENKIAPSSRLAGVGEYYFSKKLREISMLKFYDKPIINLGIGSPDMDPPKTVIDTLKDSVDMRKAHMYQSYKGTPQLRKAFSNWYQRYFDTMLNAETEVLPLMGSKEGIMHISMAFLDHGDEVLVPNPGYPSYRSATKLAGGTPVDYELREEHGWLPDIEAIKNRDLTKVKIMWINYPHMPTGQLAGDDTFRVLIDLARQNHFILVNDNPYSFILNEKPVSLLSHRNQDDTVLELNSLSKSHNMAGWRMGVLAGQANLIEEVLRFKSNMDSGMFLPAMNAAEKALGMDESWYRELNLKYMERRKYAWQLMDMIGCTYNKEQVGMFVWGRVPDFWENGEKLSDWLLQHAGIFMPPGFIFGFMGNGYIRISLCSEIPVWERALEQLKNVINKSNIKTTLVL